MIVKEYDYGWGPEWPAKQLEREILNQYLAPIKADQHRWAVINSTWYSSDQHIDVVRELHQHNIDYVVLVAMMDSAIPRAEWFDNITVYEVGYYPHSQCIDYWALLMHKYFDQSASADSDGIDTAYICLNRKPHMHRQRLYNELQSHKLLDQGLVSFGSDNGVAVRTLNNDQGGCNLAPNGGTQQNGIANDLITLGNIDNWNRCFLNIVTETVFDIQQQGFVSEKIYKPILGKRPFMVYASDCAESWLQQRGFVTYSKDFSDITDLDLTQPNNISAFLQTLVQQPKQYWRSKFQELVPKIEYNYENFYRYCNSQLDTIKQGICI